MRFIKYNCCHLYYFNSVHGCSFAEKTNLRGILLEYGKILETDDSDKINIFQYCSIIYRMISIHITVRHHDVFRVMTS